MRIRIESGGMGKNSKVVNAETGEHLENVYDATWQCNVKGIARATLKLNLVEVDVAAEYDDSAIPWGVE